MTFLIVFGQLLFLTLSLYSISSIVYELNLIKELAIGVGIIVLSLIVLFLFWVYWLTLPMQSPAWIISLIIQIILMLTGIIQIIRRKFEPSIIIPLIFCLIGSIIIASVWGFALPCSALPPIRVAAELWSHSLPGDNSIPLDLAKGFEAGRIPSPLHGDWLSSDRPPLQAAFYMATPGYWLFGTNDFTYEPVGIWLQLTILIGAFLLVRSMGFPLLNASIVMLVVFLTPITLVNSIYVWPKLIAATYLCLSVGLHFYRDRSSKLCGFLVGSSSALSFLAHGSSGFALVGMGITAIILRRIGSKSYIIAAIISFALIYSPWLAYQKYADPPGNRLLSYSFSEFKELKDLGSRGPLQAIAESYAKLSLGEILTRKFNNVSVSYRGYFDVFQISAKVFKSLVAKNTSYVKEAVKGIRALQFFGVVAGSGLFGMGFILIPVMLFSSILAPIALVNISTLFVWWLLIYDNGGAVLHVGSYFVEISIVASLAAYLLQYYSYLAIFLVAMHISLTYLQYFVV